MYFLPEVLFKKIKTALRIAFSWIVKKKKKKRIPHCNFQTCYRKQTCFFFFGLMWQLRGLSSIIGHNSQTNQNLLQNHQSTWCEKNLVACLLIISGIHCRTTVILKVFLSFNAVFKGIVSDSNNIFLRHELEGINKKKKKKKKIISKISVGSNFTFTVMHDHVHWHCSVGYCVKLILVYNENLCENCYYFTLKWFLLNCFGEMYFLGESYK